MSAAAKPKLEKARVLFDWTPSDETQLKLAPGDILTILSRHPSNPEGTEPEEWWEGELNGNVGYFPGNYVERISAEDALAQVLYDFTETGDDLIQLKAGSICALLDVSTDDWWLVGCSDKVGWFPSSFLKVLQDKDIVASQFQTTPNQQSNNNNNNNNNSTNLTPEGKSARKAMWRKTVSLNAQAVNVEIQKKKTKKPRKKHSKHHRDPSKSPESKPLQPPLPPTSEQPQPPPSKPSEETTTPPKPTENVEQQQQQQNSSPTGSESPKPVVVAPIVVAVNTKSAEEEKEKPAPPTSKVPNIEQSTTPTTTTTTNEQQQQQQQKEKEEEGEEKKVHRRKDKEMMRRIDLLFTKIQELKEIEESNALKLDQIVNTQREFGNRLQLLESKSTATPRTSNQPLSASSTTSPRTTTTTTTTSPAIHQKSISTTSLLHQIPQHSVPNQPISPNSASKKPSGPAQVVLPSTVVTPPKK